MEIKIAICDDDAPICSHMEKIVQKYLTQKAIMAEIDVFYTG